MQYRWSQSLVLLTFAAGCGRILGARFDVQPAPACDGCSGSAGGGGAGAGGRAGGARNEGGAGLGGASGGGIGGDRTGGAGGAGAASGQGAGAAGSGGSSDGTAGDDGGMSGAGGGDGETCGTNAECLDRYPGEAYICRRSACVPVMTEDCSVVLPYGDALTVLRAESPVLVGALASSAQPITYHIAQLVNWDLAVNEFASATSGGFGGGKRPLVVVACDAMDAHLIPNLRHLTLDLGISGMLTSIPSEKLVAVFNHTQSEEYRARGGRDVFFLANGSATQAQANLDDDGLVWHMLGSPAQIAEATAAVVQRIEPYVVSQRTASYEATGTDDPRTPLRLTLVAADAFSTAETANILTSGNLQRPYTNLVFNGELAILQDEFRRYDSESVIIHLSPDTAGPAEELLGNPPHIVVGIATAELAETILLVEDEWASRAPGRMRPYYVLGQGLYNALDLLQAAYLLGEVGDIAPPVHERILGINYAEVQELRARALLSAYGTRLRAFYGDSPVLSGTENYYDAAYLLFYSFAAAGAADREVTAAELRDAFENRVISDDPEAELVDIGPAALPLVLELLEDKASRVSLIGTMGEPTFDRATGVRIVPTSAWCVQSSVEDLRFAADALLYERELRTFIDPPSGPPDCADQY